MFSIEDFKKYIDFLSQTDIEELEIELTSGEKISVKRSEDLNKNIKTQTIKEKKMQENINDDSVKQQKKEFLITSPMVGRFFISPSKDHPPFIVENALVNQGQKVAIIETMRIFRDVVSPKKGVVQKILVEDGKYVEYGQPLIVLELVE